ncbi:MAG: hypothetical protein JW750_11510 [Anaerolineaceae bacterium]|nr:hypothetical protein [Anaerolineaceae bacterium]
MVKCSGPAQTLPVRGKLGWFYLLSSIIAVLTAWAAIIGLRNPSEAYPTGELLSSLRPTDYTLLFIGMPVLLLAMVLARLKKWTGLLLWPGALFYVFYTYLTYLMAVPLSAVFLLHLSLVTLSGYTLCGLMAHIDPQAVRMRLNGHVPERFAGSVLAGLGFLFFVRVIGMMANAVVSGAEMSGVDFALNRADFLAAPAWMVSGMMLWERKGFGYAAGLGMLCAGSMLFIGLMVVLVARALMAGEALPWVDMGVVGAMGLVILIPFIGFLRGVARSRRG